MAEKHLITQPSSAPTRKVTAGVLAGSLVVIAAWLCDDYLGIRLEPAVQAAFQTIVTFGLSYLVRDSL